MTSKLLKVLSVVSILAGLLLLFNKPIRHYFIQRTGEKYSVQNITRDEIKRNEQEEGQFDFDRVDTLDPPAVVASQGKMLANQHQLPVIAGLAIPSVNIRLPIFKGLANDHLIYGAATTSASQEMGKGNYGLASHRSDYADLLFTPLENVSIHDEIYITDLGTIYIYEVYNVEKVDPTRVDVLDEPTDGAPIITLITCGDLYARSRIVVQGNLVKEVPMAEITEKIAAAFDLPANSY